MTCRQQPVSKTNTDKTNLLSCKTSKLYFPKDKTNIMYVMYELLHIGRIAWTLTTQVTWD
jgi:hypothetical protein